MAGGWWLVASCSGQVRLVAHYQVRALPDELQQALIFTGGRPTVGRALRNQHNHVGFGQRLVRFPNPDGLRLIAGGAQSGGIGKAHGDAAQRNRLAHQVTSGTGSGSHDGAFALHQPVEEAGLADIGSSHDGQAQPFMYDFAIGEGVRQLFQRRANFGDARQNLLAGHDGDVIFGEIHARFEKGDEFYQLLLDWLYAVGQRAFKLLRRDFGLKQGLRINQVADGFSLGEIDAAVQEGAHGEFARLSQARSGCQRQFDDAPQNYWRAVGGDFDDVISGVRVRLREKSDHHFI